MFVIGERLYAHPVYLLNFTLTLPNIYLFLSSTEDNFSSSVVFLLLYFIDIH